MEILTIAKDKKKNVCETRRLRLGVEHAGAGRQQVCIFFSVLYLPLKAFDYVVRCVMSTRNTMSNARQTITRLMTDYGDLLKFYKRSYILLKKHSTNILHLRLIITVIIFR